MDHKEALQAMAAEKYLLNESSANEREEFEEHYFCCDLCAEDLKAGAVLLEASRGLLAFQPAAATVRPKMPRREWLAWFRPAFAVPAMAFMLGLVVFQNAVQFPALNRAVAAMNHPEILPSAYLASGNARGEDHVIAAQPGKLFELTIDIPDSGNAAHVAELDDATGKKEWLLPIPADAPKENLTLKMPADLPAGNYALIVRKATADEGSSSSPEVSRYQFTLHRQ